VSQNKATVQKFMNAFSRSDHAQILSCLTDEIEWIMPGMFRLIGKEAFDKEIQNDAFVGSPTIDVTRMTEENNVVVAEGSVRSARRDGGFLNAVFCDVLEMEDSKIKRLISFVTELKE